MDLVIGLVLGSLVGTLVTLVLHYERKGGRDR